MRAKLWPDGSLKLIRVIFPVALAAAPDAPNGSFTERIVTIEKDTPSESRSWAQHADVTAALADTAATLRVALSWQDASHSREEGTIEFNDATLIEESPWHKRYHRFARLGNSTA